MLFNSFDFLLFFPVVLFLYFLLPVKYRQLWLLVASYYFYMGWDAKYALLIFFVTLVSYAGGLWLQGGPPALWATASPRGGRRRADAGERQQAQRRACFFVCASLILCVLFVFKYLDFFAGNLLRVLRLAGLSQRESVSFGLVLPVGISFYTFQALGYLADVYRREIPAERSFLKYALFVSFFPQLVAGPIERSKNLLQQLRAPRAFDYDMARNGLLLMLWGYFEKICIADTAAVYVNRVFESYESVSPITVTWATVIFAVQIYCDFGGYSHIAIGAAQVLGIRLMDNFRQPYFAEDIRDFWRRWHISLSTWFRDYVYIPLGGSRCKRPAYFRNLMLTFLVSGLWHGASWNYVVWGGLHGAYQVAGALTKGIRERIRRLLHISGEQPLYRFFRRCVTFVLCDLAWLFFRAPGARQAVAMLRYMINPTAFAAGGQISDFTQGMDMNQVKRLYAGILLLIAVDALHERGVSIRNWYTKRNICFRWTGYLVILMGFVVLLIQNYGLPASEFIYFQF